MPKTAKTAKTAKKTNDKATYTQMRFLACAGEITEILDQLKSEAKVMFGIMPDDVTADSVKMLEDARNLLVLARGILMEGYE